MSAEINRAAELAESLRAMRRNARLHHFGASMERHHSITMDSTRLGDLSDAADLLEKLATELRQHQRSEFHPDWSLLQAARESLREKMAEIERLNAPAVLLTDEQLRAAYYSVDSSQDSSRTGIREERLRAVQAAVLAADGKAGA
jgi:RNA polymerase-interacting CarD/CdnL/TRCF family regulator